MPPVPPAKLAQKTAAKKTAAKNKPGRSRKARADRRRKGRKRLVEHDLSDAQWAALREAWAGCAYCGQSGKPMHRDCVLPISRGGRYTLENIVPACASCNTSKCNSEVTSWLRRKRLKESQFLLRHFQIKAKLLLLFPPTLAETTAKAPPLPTQPKPLRAKKTASTAATTDASTEARTAAAK